MTVRLSGLCTGRPLPPRVVWLTNNNFNKWINNLETPWMKQSWPNKGTVLEFLWRDWGKATKSSVRIAQIPAKIWKNHLPIICLNLWWTILFDHFQHGCSLVSTHIYKTNGHNEGQTAMLKPNANRYVHHLLQDFMLHCLKTQSLTHSFIKFNLNLLNRIQHFWVGERGWKMLTSFLVLGKLHRFVIFKVIQCTR
jgi:hypothetical protein